MAIFLLAGLFVCFLVFETLAEEELKQLEILEDERSAPLILVNHHSQVSQMWRPIHLQSKGLFMFQRGALRMCNDFDVA